MEVTHRVLFVTLGSRGDAQPYIATANRLISAGHEVGIATNKTFEGFVQEHGSDIHFFPMEGDPAAIIQSKEFEDAFYIGDKQKQMQILMTAMKDHTKTNISLTHKYVLEFQPTCLIGSIVNLGECLALGQKYLIPVLCASTVPAYPSAELPMIGISEKPLGIGWLNKGLAQAMWKLQWLYLGKDINELRTNDLKIPPMDTVGLDYVPILQMFSTKVVPRPKDYPPHVLDTGYWILPPKEEYEPSEEIVEYLESGDAPVYIGFGSMPVKDKQGVLNKFSVALKKTGKRGIYCGGWSGVEGVTMPDNILHIDGAPHEWLLPKCCMAFHHGGAGTTAASLRAGIPTVILYVLVDQPFWSSRVIDLGVGQSEPCALKEVTEDYIEHQIKHCLKEDVRKKAIKLANKLCEEDGTFEAASYIVSYATKKKNPGIKALDYKQDSSTKSCMDCYTDFTLFNRRHHCMSCGNIYCSKCVKYFDLPNYETWRYCCRSCATLWGFDFAAQP